MEKNSEVTHGTLSKGILEWFLNKFLLDSNRLFWKSLSKILRRKSWSNFCKIFWEILPVSVARILRGFSKKNLDWGNFLKITEQFSSEIPGKKRFLKESIADFLNLSSKLLKEFWIFDFLREISEEVRGRWSEWTVWVF